MPDAAGDGDAQFEAILFEAIVALLRPLLQGLEALGFAARHLHPPDLAELVAAIGEREAPLRQGLEQFRAITWPDRLAGFRDQLDLAAAEALAAFDGLRAAVGDPNGPVAAYRALRRQARASEALYPLASALKPISQFFLEPGRRDDANLLAALGEADPSRDKVGVIHVENARDQRGGFSLYVPEYLDATRTVPLIVALHGGSGHGRTFLWTWLNEARSRGALLVSPTATGATWSLAEPAVDGEHLRRILDFVGRHWRIDPARRLLTGMSDGGTFTYVAGLQADSPFTHLAPVSASFHPMLLSFMDAGRIRDLPIRIVHGALDWMFPAAMARGAEAALRSAGARVVHREIADLSHTYPREENPATMDWFLGGA
jgi:phospholipase/carboxylesterase